MIAAGGESHKVTGHGDVLVNFSDKEIKLKNVFYVPGIKWNLLSVGCIADQGYSTEFLACRCYIKDV